ncbi:hypothetical protein [Gallaecimonas pentaromativorans]|uniref:hypothetical protein n=1 Tax=Gallaecimonas pentaromativorans TaxID=584787 RepID=UPI003A95B4BD
MSKRPVLKTRTFHPALAFCFRFLCDFVYDFLVLFAVFIVSCATFLPDFFGVFDNYVTSILEVCSK